MNKNQNGFSLIELLLVVVIIGIVSTIAIPSLMKARAAAENGGAISTMRSLSTLQTNHFQQKNRYGRLDEITASQQSRFGVYDAGTSTLARGSFTFQMDPFFQSDAELQNGFKIIATRIVTGNDQPYVLEVAQDGEIKQIMP